MIEHTSRPEGAGGDEDTAGRTAVAEPEAGPVRGLVVVTPSHRPAGGAPQRFTGPPPRGTGRPPIARLTWLLSRPGAQSLATIALPVIAFTVMSALVLIVVGGTMMFWRWDTEAAVLYQVLSVFALAILIVPLVSLGGAAARLSARRRDDRLSTLRLLGATPSDVTRMTILESSAVALLGAGIGAVVYAVTMPLVGLLSFNGAMIGPFAVWVGAPVLVGVIVAIGLLAAVSAAIGLRAVNVSPLGVRTRQQAATVHWIRPVIGAVLILGLFGALTMLGGFAGVVIIAIIVLAFAAGIGVVNLVGPFAIGVVGRVALRGAKTPAKLLAARGILESPKAAWRQVSGVAMTSFIAVVAGTGLALVDLAGDAGGSDESQVIVADVRTGIFIILAVSFMMVSCSVAVNQASEILDRRALSVSLDRLGMPQRAMERARSRAVLLPLRTVAIGSAVIGAVLVFPLTGMAIILAPVSVLVIVLCLAAGIGLVWLSLRATRPVLTSVLRAPERV
ncbi:FtsX-like permease family protein [Plantibacter sp. Mn2098]|uniref:FtsX-like permease family protein n=1 Tax=Plantibacter sp. Mn2098 TaxID=3395266 RepID=UPI003BE838C3